MKNIKSTVLLGFIAIMALVTSACTEKTEQASDKKDASGDHVWKTQTDALQSAKDMADEMQKSLKQQQEKMNENN